MRPAERNKYHVMIICESRSTETFSPAGVFLQSKSIDDDGSVTMMMRNRFAGAYLNGASGFLRTNRFFETLGPLKCSAIKVSAEHYGRLCSTAGLVLKHM